MKNRNLAFKLNLAILSVTALVFLSVFIYNYRVSRELILRNVEENTRNLTSSAINKSEGFFRSIEKVALNFSYVVMDEPADTAATLRLLKDIVGKNEEIFGSCVAWRPEPRGKDTLYYAPYFCKSGDSLIYRNLGNLGYRYPEWEWYRAPVRLGRPVWSEPYFDEGGGDALMATYSVPFFSEENDTSGPAGVVTADVSLKWLQEVVSEIRIFKTGYAFLISREGVIITHPEEELVLRESIFSLADSLKDEELRRIGENMVAGGEDFVSVEAGFFRERSWIYYNSLDNNNWSIAFVFPESELYADLRELNRRLIVMAIGGLLVLLALIVLIARRVTQPVRKLVAAAREIGHGKLDLEITPLRSRDEVGQLQDSFIRMQMELRTFITDLKKATAEREKVESELKIAREIQMGLVPLGGQVSTSHDPEVFGLLEPARTVGGDLFDYFFPDPEHMFFVIGDVSGKGIPAAMFMAVTVTAMRTAARLEGNRLGAVMAPVSEHLFTHNPGSFFVTLFAGVMEVKTGKVQFMNFGHNPPYVLKKSGQAVRIEPISGLPLGIRKTAVMEPFELQLQPGDTLVLYTDGITEAGDMEGRFFAESKLASALSASAGKDPRSLLEDLIRDVHAFARGHEQDDDMAALAIAFHGIHTEEAKVLNLGIAATREAIEEVHEKVKAFLEGKVHPMIVFRAELVLEEILINTITYAYGNAEGQTISIRVILNESGPEFSITDTAAPFNPFDESYNSALQKREGDPGGRGLLLVRGMAEPISFDQVNGRNILVFRLKDA